MVAGLAAGDPSALDGILRLYWPAVAVYAERALKDADAARDVSQETFIRLWRSRAEVPPEALRAFIFRTARNLVIDEVRKRAVRGRFAEATSQHARTSESPADVFDAAETRDAIAQALEQLPPRRRESFILAYMHDLTYREVAEILGISAATVKNQVATALSDLRRALGPQRIR